MKKLFLTFMALLIASPAFAFGNSGTVFALYSAASAAVKTSSAIDVRKYSTKTLHVSGATLASNAASLTFKNMSGTAIVQCAPTSSGPWSTCIANGYAQTAISLTTNNVMTWKDATPYIRFKWTAGTVGTKLKAYLNYIE